MDLEDHDSDGVPDIEDNCPSTPNGVKVNESDVLLMEIMMEFLII